MIGRASSRLQKAAERATDRGRDAARTVKERAAAAEIGEIGGEPGHRDRQDEMFALAEESATMASPIDVDMQPTTCPENVSALCDGRATRMEAEARGERPPMVADMVMNFGGDDGHEFQNDGNDDPLAVDSPFFGGGER